MADELRMALDEVLRKAHTDGDLDVPTRALTVRWLPPECVCELSAH